MEYSVKMNIVLEAFMQDFSSGKLQLKLSKEEGFTIIEAIEK